MDCVGEVPGGNVSALKPDPIEKEQWLWVVEIHRRSFDFHPSFWSTVSSQYY